jgi:prevent-host-death family protein
MPARTYNVHEAKAQLSRLLREVASGSVLIIAKAGKPLARVSRIEEDRPTIRFGVLKGKAKISANFDAPLPDALLSEFERD